jgi:hypothetical protein
MPPGWQTEELAEEWIEGDEEIASGMFSTGAFVEGGLMLMLSTKQAVISKTNIFQTSRNMLKILQRLHWHPQTQLALYSSSPILARPEDCHWRDDWDS